MQQKHTNRYVFVISLLPIILEAMDIFLIPLHSIFRWLVLLSILYAIGRAYSGYKSNRDFTGHDNQIKHWTATIAHIQLVIGMILYIRSPLTSYFWKDLENSLQHLEIVFLGFLHPLLMIIAVMMITIDSSLAKRKKESTEKYKTMLI